MAVAFGFLLYKTVLADALVAGWALAIKLRGDAPGCTWSRLLTVYPDKERLYDLQDTYEARLAVEARDATAGIERFRSPKGSFWISRKGEKLDGKKLLAFLLAEQDWFQEEAAERVVRKGEVVLDCGAHVGVFTAKALELGASRVVAVEPDPVNLECLRRNLAGPIAAGRVIVVAKGVWSSDTKLQLHLGVDNSGMGTVMHDQGGSSIEIPVTTVDRLVADLNLARVDYVKMDIEGAEREALAGAYGTLRRFRPRLMLDTYHEADDAVELPRIVRAAHSGYQAYCGPCELRTDKTTQLVPHVTFFE